MMVRYQIPVASCQIPVAKKSLILVTGYWLLVTTLVFLRYGYCFAQPVSSTDLINNAKEYDGKIVTYEGEVIGDIMVRGEYAWINVNDGVNAVGIWAPKDLAGGITSKGTYGKIGDRIEIKGIFNRSCKEHGGDLDIHAESLIKLKEGYQITEPLDPVKMRYAALFGVILIIVSIWKFYKKFISPSSGQ